MRCLVPAFLLCFFIPMSVCGAEKVAGNPDPAVTPTPTPYILPNHEEEPAFTQKLLFVEPFKSPILSADLIHQINKTVFDVAFLCDEYQTMITPKKQELDNPKIVIHRLNVNVLEQSERYTVQVAIYDVKNDSEVKKITRKYIPPRRLLTDVRFILFQLFFGKAYAEEVKKKMMEEQRQAKIRHKKEKRPRKERKAQEKIPPLPKEVSIAVLATVLPTIVPLETPLPTPTITPSPGPTAVPPKKVAKRPPPLQMIHKELAQGLKQEAQKLATEKTAETPAPSVNVVRPDPIAPRPIEDKTPMGKKALLSMQAEQSYLSSVDVLRVATNMSFIGPRAIIRMESAENSYNGYIFDLYMGKTTRSDARYKFSAHTDLSAGYLITLIEHTFDLAPSAEYENIQFINLGTETGKGLSLYSGNLLWAAINLTQRIKLYKFEGVASGGFGKTLYGSSNYQWQSSSLNGTKLTGTIQLGYNRIKAGFKVVKYFIASDQLLTISQTILGAYGGYEF